MWCGVAAARVQSAGCALTLSALLTCLHDMHIAGHFTANVGACYLTKSRYIDYPRMLSGLPWMSFSTDKACFVFGMFDLARAMYYNNPHSTIPNPCKSIHVLVSS